VHLLSMSLNWLFPFSKEKYSTMTSVFCPSVNICTLFRLNGITGMVSAVQIKLFLFWTLSHSVTADLYLNTSHYYINTMSIFSHCKKYNPKHCTHLTYTKPNLSTTNDPERSAPITKMFSLWRLNKRATVPYQNIIFTHQIIKTGRNTWAFNT
jgi:hypothetical protein